MGIVRCNVHEHGAIVETCRHIGAQIHQGISPAGHRFAVLSELFLCDDCFNTLGFGPLRRFFNLPIGELLDIDEASSTALDRAYDSIEGRCIFCAECIAEIERQQPSSRQQ